MRATTITDAQYAPMPMIQCSVARSLACTLARAQARCQSNSERPLQSWLKTNNDKELNDLYGVSVELASLEGRSASLGYVRHISANAIGATK